MHQTFESNTVCESMVNEGNMSVSAAFTMAWVSDWEGGGTDVEVDAEGANDNLMTLISIAWARR